MTASALGPAEGAALRRFLAVEIVINAIASGILSAVFVWLMFGGVAQVPLWGMHGLAFDLVPTTFMITLMMTLGLTVFTRWRCATGRAPTCAGATRLPRRLFWRALLLAVVLTLILVPPGIIALGMLGPDPWRYGSVMLFKIIYGVLLAAAITPIIVLAAMREAFAFSRP